MMNRKTAFPEREGRSELWGFSDPVDTSGTAASLRTWQATADWRQASRDLLQTGRTAVDDRPGANQRSS